MTARARSLLGVVIGSALVSGAIVGGATVARSVAPAASASTYAVIGALPLGARTTEIHIAGAETVASADDTIFVGTNGAVVVYPPLAESGTTGTSVSVDGEVSAMTSGAGPGALYVALTGFSDDSLAAFPLTVTGGVPTVQISVADRISGLAMGGQGSASPDDDTVYAVGAISPDGVVSFSSGLVDTSTTVINAPTLAPSTILVSGASTTGLEDDTVYVGGNRTGGNHIVQLTPNLEDSSSIPASVWPGTLALYDDSLIFGSASGVWAINLANFDDTGRFPLYTGDLAVNSAGAIAAVYVFYPSPSTPVPMPIIDSAGMAELASLELGIPSPGGADLAAASDGTFYMATGQSGEVLILDKISAGSMTPTSGSAATTVTLPFTTASGRLADDSTVEAVWWGQTSVPFSRVAGQNTIEVNVPADSGTVDVVVQLRGGEGLAMGSFVGPNPPQPPPTFPPSAPRDIVAVAGDAQATISWSAPASNGSFPITTYQVRDSSGSHGCIYAVGDDTGLACQINGLANGVEYSFDVRALNGAGWGPWSEASDPVTPRQPASIVIAGTRGAVDGRPGVIVTGSSTGLVGSEVTPWLRFPGPKPYQPGTGVRVVAPDGSFTWQRMTGKKVYVYFRSDEVKSNRVIIRLS